MKVLLANPRGFCAGVDRAIEIVEKALELIGPPIYVRHEVVHNRFVVDSLRERGAIFVDRLDDVPDGQTVIFSAHGVAQRVKQEAEERGLQVFDATCPLVSKVHIEAERHHRNGLQMVMIGHAGHPETVGTMGQLPEGEVLLVETVDDVARVEPRDPEKLAFITQTTLSVDDTADIVAALETRFPDLTAPSSESICYATTNRQHAVRELIDQADLLLVLGSQNSSNSRRLMEIGHAAGKPAYLIDGRHELQPEWFAGIELVVVTAGASAGPKTGAHAETKYHKGMAVFVHIKGGLMYEASIGGQKFKFKPFEVREY